MIRPKLPSALAPLVVLLALPFAGCTGGPAECPAIALDCAEGFAPADTDGDGCDDACEEVPVPSETACLADAECADTEVCDTVSFCDAAPGCGGDEACLAVCYGRCVEVVQCEAYPVCDEGDTQVDGESNCLQDDAVCYARTLCGTTIWCTGPSDAPQACLVDEECGDTAVCDTVTYCDAAPGCDGDEGCLAVCYGRCVEEATCLAYPVCDEGHSEVESESACLQDDAVCYQRSICGVSIWCTGPA